MAIERYWKSPWGFKENEPVPDKAEFVREGKLNYLFFEDFLQHNAVFYNLLQNRVCHMDSYMTGVDYDNLDFCFDLLSETYQVSKGQWGGYLDKYEADQPNMQIPAKIALFHLRSRIK